jgi:RasGEF N-terminal motif
VQPSSQPNRTSLPLLKSDIFKDMLLSSSPPSRGGLSPKDPRPAPRPIPSPSAPSPLFLDSQNRYLYTPESLTSVSPPRDHLDTSNPLPPLLLQGPSTPHTKSSLLLDPIDLTSSQIPDGVAQLDRASSISSGSVYSTDNLPTTNSPGSLLDAAVCDTERVLRISADGTVEAGTLEGLVDRLLRETHERAKDDEAKKVFLATYRLFTTDEIVFGIFKRRFKEMEVSDASNLSVPRGSIRHPCVLRIHSDGFTDASIKHFTLSANLAPGRWRKHGP